MVDVTSISLVIAAVSVVVGTVFHILSLRRAERDRRLALETRQIGVYMDFARFSQSKEFLNAFTDVLYLQKWKDYGEWVTKYGPGVNPESTANLSMIVGFWDNLGVLVSKEILDLDIIYEQQSGKIIDSWERVAPIIKELRKGDRSAFSFFEYLYNEMKNKREKK